MLIHQVFYAIHTHFEQAGEPALTKAERKTVESMFEDGKPVDTIILSLVRGRDPEEQRQDLYDSFEEHARADGLI